MLNGPGVNVNWVPGITLEEMEKNVILAAFRFYRGNKTQTAGGLGISIRTLDNKLERYEADAQIERQNAEQRKLADAATLAKFRGPALTRQFSTGSSSQWAVDGAVERAGNGEASQEGDEAFGETETPGRSAPAGSSVQSAAPVGAEPTMPLPKRGEVQKVLPRQTPASGNRRNR